MADGLSELFRNPCIISFSASQTKLKSRYTTSTVGEVCREYRSIVGLYPV